MEPEDQGPDPATTREILTVGQLNRAVASLLDKSIPPLRVRGEISNFTRAASGHWYFTLKDATAQVRAVMFRHRAQQVGFVPREGDSVQLGALAGFYQARGEFQLNVEVMLRAGAGDLHQRFVELRERLRAEGLFDQERKRELPKAPGCIGIITSLQAAALRDVLTTLRRRAPQLPVVIYPSAVQGAQAPAALIAALRAAAARAECDVLMLVRGGGSIEDLWAFNDEQLAREISQCALPVVSGVGHESDFTIADFVADLRAATPTAAAQAVSTDRRDSLISLQALTRRLAMTVQRAQTQAEQRVDTATRLLRSPAARWQQRAGLLDALAMRLRATQRQNLGKQAQRADSLRRALQAPDLAALNVRIEQAGIRLARAAKALGQRRLELLESLSHKLDLVSPQEVLRRGYAIVQTAGGEVVRSATQVCAGQALAVQLASGGLDVQVARVRGGGGEQT
ncbi:MAG: exodeoxyribonuclease VII large subunit [Quisquiliibacterium sp.]